MECIPLLKKKVLLELVRSRTQNFTVFDQKKHKIKQIYVWNPRNIDLLCKHCFTSSIWRATDVPPGETSLEAKSKEKRLYSHATCCVPL